MTAAGIAICGEWCQKIIYNEPSSSCGEGLFVKKGNPKGLHSYEDLIKKGGKVAIMAGAEQLRMIQAPSALSRLLKKSVAFAHETGIVSVVDVDVSDKASSGAESCPSTTTDRVALVLSLP